jgi:Predicted alternative 3-dehydroquinate synthase
MRSVLYKAVPYVKEEVALALESGVDGLIVPAPRLEAASRLARCRVLSEDDLACVTLRANEDEAVAAEALSRGKTVLLARGWEIIPVENLLAHGQANPHKGELALEVCGADEASLAARILERGVDTVVVPQEAVTAIRDIVSAMKQQGATFSLCPATITEVRTVGMGHRVCVDTLSVLKKGQGMLVGNSAAFTFLVNAETEHNEYVASRPFRINAGAVHAYAVMPGDKTSYLEELAAGNEVLVVDEQGQTSTAVVGRVKVERRPMLLVRARAEGQEGAVFLQNAETIRLVTPEGEARSVVELAPGDTVLCRLDVAGRHFGMRINEEIKEN